MPVDLEALQGQIDQINANAALAAAKKPKLSADIEFFLLDKSTDTFVPSTGLTKGGTKGNPVWIDRYTGILEDNVALELNMPPSTSESSFHSVVRAAHQGLAGWVNSQNLRLKYGNCQKIPATAAINNPSVNEFGCSEDFIAYGNTPDKARKPITAKSLGDNRYAAGHLHLSYDTTDLPAFVVARWLDATIGLYSVGWDQQAERRQFYGLAGLFRPTKYPDGSEGVEYRTLSNLWFFDKNMAYRLGGAIFGLMRRIRQDMSGAKAEYSGIPWGDIRAAINEASPEACNELIAYLRKTSKIAQFAHDEWLVREGLTFKIEA